MLLLSFITMDGNQLFYTRSCRKFELFLSMYIERISEWRTYSSISTRWISFNVSKLILCSINTPSYPCLVHDWEINASYIDYCLFSYIILAFDRIKYVINNNFRKQRWSEYMLEDPRLPLMIFVREYTKQ